MSILDDLDLRLLTVSEQKAWRVLVLPSPVFGAVYQLERWTRWGWLCVRRQPGLYDIMQDFSVLAPEGYPLAHNVLARLPQQALYKWERLKDREQLLGRDYWPKWVAAVRADRARRGAASGAFSDFQDDFPSVVAVPSDDDEMDFDESRLRFSDKPDDPVFGFNCFVDPDFDDDGA